MRGYRSGMAKFVMLSTIGPDGFAFEPAGRRQLKGFAQPVRVVSVGRRPA